MDTFYLDMLHAHIMISFRLLPSMAEHLAAPCGPQASIPHHYHATSRPDHAFPLVHVNELSGQERELPSGPATHHDGRRMPAVI